MGYSELGQVATVRTSLWNISEICIAIIDCDKELREWLKTTGANI
jgi:hypothetical protein